MKKLILIILISLFCSGVLYSQELPVCEPEHLPVWFSENFTPTWTIPDEHRSLGEVLNTMKGDCEDYAILTSAILDYNNVENKLLVLKFEGMDMMHAICVYKTKLNRYNFFSNGKLYDVNCKSIEILVHKFYPDCIGILNLQDIR